MHNWDETLGLIYNKDIKRAWIYIGLKQPDLASSFRGREVLIPAACFLRRCFNDASFWIGFLHRLLVHQPSDSRLTGTSPKRTGEAFYNHVCALWAPGGAQRGPAPVRSLFFSSESLVGWVASAASHGESWRGVLGEETSAAASEEKSSAQSRGGLGFSWRGVWRSRPDGGRSGHGRWSVTGSRCRLAEGSPCESSS